MIELLPILLRLRFIPFLFISLALSPQLFFWMASLEAGSRHWLPPPLNKEAPEVKSLKFLFIGSKNFYLKVMVFLFLKDFLFTTTTFFFFVHSLFSFFNSFLFCFVFFFKKKKRRNPGFPSLAF